RVAEDRVGPGALRCPSRCLGPDPRRARRPPRRPRRGRPLRALPRHDGGIDDHRDLAPFLHRAPGVHHRRAARRRGGRAGNARRIDGPWWSLRRDVPPAGRPLRRSRRRGGDGPVRSWMRMGRLLVSIGWDIGPLVFLAYVVVNITTFVGPFLFALGLRPLVNGIFEHSNGSAALGAAMCSVALLLAVASPAAYRWTTIRLRERSIMVMQRRLLILSTSAPSLDHFERPQFFDRLQLLKRSSYELVMRMTIATVGPVILVQLVATSIVLARLQPLLLLLPFIAVPATWIHQRAEKMRRAGEER